MATEVLMPRQGQSVESCIIIEWKVNEGDVVAEEDSLITLESDKATMEIPSPEAGTVKSIKVSVGDKISQGNPIVVLELSADAPAAAPTEPEEQKVETKPVEQAPQAEVSRQQFVSSISHCLHGTPFSCRNSIPRVSLSYFL